MHRCWKREGPDLRVRALSFVCSILKERLGSRLALWLRILVDSGRFFARVRVCSGVERNRAALGVTAVLQLLYTEDTHSSGFFLKKKPPCMPLDSACVLENRSSTSPESCPASHKRELLPTLAATGGSC